jgi:hypothetical protein
VDNFVDKHVEKHGTNCEQPHGRTKKSGRKKGGQYDIKRAFSVTIRGAEKAPKIWDFRDTASALTSELNQAAIRGEERRLQLDRARPRQIRL